METILNYIEQDNPLASVEFEENILNSYEFLAANPLAGRERPEFTDKPYRFWVAHNNYLIAYSLRESAIVIRAILHTARDISRLL